jgi:8-amino-7-oxononanoate synthase
VFSSGYLANLTVLTALAAVLGAPDEVLIVSDAGNHASLIDGCRLSASSARVRVTVTPHRDHETVRKVLADRDEPAAIVVSDAVFSVDGTQAPVAELHAAAREHGALLVLDEAHAFGVTGPGGRGAAAEAGIAAEPDLIRTVTLSKALAGQGGAVLAAPEVIATLVDTGRGFIFDTGLAPPSAAAALAALEVVAAEPEGGDGPAGRDRGGRGLAGQPVSGRRARGDGGRIRRGRSGPKDLCGLRCARWLLPAARGPPRPGLPAAGRPGQSDRQRLRGCRPRAGRGEGSLR